VVGRGRADRADQRQLPGVRGSGGRAESGRPRDAGEIGRGPEARRGPKEDPVICNERVAPMPPLL